MIMGVTRLPERGETVTDGMFLKTFGGKGANQAVAAQRAGAKVSFVTCVGRDDHGDSVMAALLKEGIDTQWVVRSRDSATGAALVLFDRQGANYLAVAPGSNYDLAPEHLDPVFAGQDFDMLLLQYEIAEDTLHAALDQAESRQIPVLFNYAPARPLGREITPSNNICLVVNELEASVLADRPVRDVETAMEAARAFYHRGYGFAIVTLGALGACIASRDGGVHVGSRSVRAVDTTAAGDTFCGVLGVALAEGRTLHNAAQMASSAASLCVQRAGAQPSIPRRDEVDKLHPLPAVRPMN
jgi:ribokinase